MEPSLPAGSTPAGLIDQLLAMGGPVMGVLIAMAAIGAVAFVYLMLVGTLLAPRLTGFLKRALRQWHSAPERTVVDNLRSSCRGLRALNPRPQHGLAGMEGRLHNEPPERIRETVSPNALRGTP